MSRAPCALSLVIKILGIFSGGLTSGCLPATGSPLLCVCGVSFFNCEMFLLYFLPLISTIACVLFTSITRAGDGMNVGADLCQVIFHQHCITCVHLAVTVCTFVCIVLYFESCLFIIVIQVCIHPVTVG